MECIQINVDLCANDLVLVVLSKFFFCVFVLMTKVGMKLLSFPPYYDVDLSEMASRSLFFIKYILRMCVKAYEISNTAGTKGVRI